MKNVFVGISGGVDSAVSAHLLIEQGYNVTGVFLKNWSGNDYGLTDNCPWKEDLESAKAVCDHLKIPLKVYNFEKEYRDLVIEDFFYQYSIGNTPNPDILCNKYIKFDKFLSKALEDGADYIATGHYSKTENGRLYKAKDKSKDQTYFLHQLTHEQLSRSLFPLSDLLKSQVRDIATRIKLPNADRKDSQGICFIGKVDISDFLKERLKEVQGDIVDFDTKEVVGEHNGVWFYTVGQRKGIAIGGVAQPYFVHSKNVKKNILYVVQGKQNPLLWSDTVYVKDFHFINEIPNETNLTATIRYRSQDSDVKVDWEKDVNLVSGKFIFKSKQWAPAIGQSIVVFNNDECIGGGIITAV